MGRQLSIRSDRAHELATRIAKRRDLSLAKAVEQVLAEVDALDQARERESKEQKLARWMALLEEGWKHRDPDCSFKIEDLYDPETGLPV